MEDKFLNGRGLKEYTAKVKEKMAFIEDPTTSGLPMSLVNLFYPVGSIYISMNSSFNPNTAWGGTWTKIEAGRFIEATTTAAQVAGTVEPGLPNITGEVYGDEVTRDTNVTYTGAFSATGKNGNFAGGGYNYFLPNGFKLDASVSSPIYGNSTTVQPKSIKAYVWRRTA